MPYQANWYRENVSVREVLDEVVDGANARALRDRFQLEDELGAELFAELVARVQREAAFRRGLVEEMRPFAWQVRNARLLSVGAVIEAAETLLHFFDLLEAAGISEDLLRRLVSCLLDGCVCEGCDLYDGQRLASFWDAAAWCRAPDQQSGGTVGGSRE